MSVFGNDFAAVDLREELCYHSLTEKANSGCMSEVKRAKKKAPIIVGACRYGSGEVYFYFVVIQNDSLYEQVYERLRLFFERLFIVFPYLRFGIGYGLFAAFYEDEPFEFFLPCF